MSFLRIEALWALPLVLLPVLIHLIHRRKHPTVPWAAMMFIGRAAQSRRGGARLRRWLILAVRTLVVAAVLIALARPLSSGVFGFAAGRVASTTTAVVLSDRSPSMQRRDAAGETRQTAGLRRISETLETLGVGRIVLLDSVRQIPQQVGSPDALLQPTLTRSADSTADIPRMLRDALRYLETQDRRVADIWVCSDRQLIDWRPESPLWQEIGTAAGRMGKAVRFHLLEFAGDDRINHSVSVTEHRLVKSNAGTELSISLAIAGNDPKPETVPVRVSVNGKTSSVDVEMKAGSGVLDDYRIDVTGDQGEIAGRVSIPADVNAADDGWCFTAAVDSDRPIGLATESRCLALEAAADVLGTIVSTSNTGVDDAGAKSVETGSVASFDTEILGRVACLLWQGALPGGEQGIAVEAFLKRGGSVVFFPPAEVDGGHEFRGVRWGSWQRDVDRQANFDEWDFTLAASCSIEGDLVRRAAVGSDTTLAGKLRVGEGTAWFCGTEVIGEDSRFVQDGLMLFGVLSEAIEASRLFERDHHGLVAGRETQQRLQRDRAAGAVLEPAAEGISDQRSSESGGPDDVAPMGESTDVALLELGHHAGLFSIASADGTRRRLIAINRSVDESDRSTVSLDALDALSPPLSWKTLVVEAGAGATARGFVREVWGGIWMLVIAGMMFEAWLTLPSRKARAAR